MPPTFLLVAAIILAALLAPAVFTAAVLSRAVPRLRPLGLRVLRAGAVGAAVGLAVNAAINLFLRELPSPDGVLIAVGFGFMAGGLGWPLWYWARAPLPDCNAPAA